MKQIILTLFITFISLPAYAAIPESNQINFEILRNGKPFGTHSLNFSRQDNQLIVDINIEMNYYLGPIRVFKYRHTNQEIWDSGAKKLVSFQAQTDDDGKDLYVNAFFEGGKTIVEGSDGSYEAKGNILGTTYWHQDMLKQSRLINTQYGTLDEITITDLGEEDFEVQDKIMTARHYRMNDGTREVDFWYDVETGQWVGLKFEIRGSNLEYRLLTPLEGHS